VITVRRFGSFSLKNRGSASIAFGQQLEVIDEITQIELCTRLQELFAY